METSENVQSNKCILEVQMSNRVQRNCLNPALVFTLSLYDFIVVCTFDIIHQFLVPTIWNSVSCRFVSSLVAEENWTLFKTASTKKCQMKFFYLMDSCHSNFLSNLRLKWGTKNGAKESSDPDKIRIEHSIPRTFLSRGEKTYYILVDIYWRLWRVPI